MGLGTLGASATRALTQRVTSRHGLFLLLLVTLVLYWPAFFGQFTNWDDGAFVTDNALVRAPDLVAIFDPRTIVAGDWTPLVTVSHAIEYHLFGLDPFVFHAVNVLLHVLNTALAYWLLCCIGVGRWEALAVAAIFALHPLQVEPVCWISTRKNELALFFGFGFLIAFLSGYCWSATALLALALCSKVIAAVLPTWALLAAALQRGRLNLRRALPWCVLYFAMAAARGGLSLISQTKVAALHGTTRMTLAERMATEGPILVHQLRQFFLPVDLSALYQYQPHTFADPAALASWALLLAVAGLILRMARRDALMLIAGFWTITAILPTANVWPAPSLQADRYMQLALVGGGLMVVRLVAAASGGFRACARALVAVWCVGVLVPLTHARIPVWHDSGTLWRDTVRRYPTLAFAWEMLASHHFVRGELAPAQDALRNSLAAVPDQPNIRFNLASILHRRGENGAAIAELRTILARHPEHAAAHRLLGTLLAEAGDAASGLAELDESLRLQPNSLRSRFERARLRASRGQPDEAAADLAVLLAAGDDSATVLSLLSSVRSEQGRHAEALDLARRATVKQPQLAEAWDALTRALLAAGDVDGAEAAVAQGLRMAPTSCDLYYRRAQLATRRGESVAARDAARHALELLGHDTRSWADDARRLVD